MVEIILGFIAGNITGMGMGGGAILILFLSLLLHLDQHIAQATNLIFFIPTAIASIIINIKEKNVDLKLAKIVSVFGVIGAIIGIAVIIMFIITLSKLLKEGEKIPTTTDSISSYFSVYTNNKWGVINSKGEYVIDPAYTEMIVIPDNKSDIFIITYDIDYDKGTYKTKVLNNCNFLFTSSSALAKFEDQRMIELINMPKVNT